MREIVRICFKYDLNLADEIRRFVSELPKDAKSGVYSFDKDSGQ